MAVWDRDKQYQISLPWLRFEPDRLGEKPMCYNRYTIGCAKLSNYGSSLSYVKKLPDLGLWTYDET